MGKSHAFRCSGGGLSFPSEEQGEKSIRGDWSSGGRNRRRSGIRRSSEYRITIFGVFKYQDAGFKEIRSKSHT